MNMNLGDTRLLIEAGKSAGLLRNQMAYVLATAYHETAHTMKPINERGGDKYLRSKKYWPYIGRGYVQITWLENYRKASKLLGVDFVKSPNLLLEPKYAAHIIIQGMKDGWFAGDGSGRHKLSRYITLKKSDYRSARRIVNGMDKADLIAGYAREYDKLLLADGYGVDTVVEAPANDILPEPDKPETVSHSKRFWTWLTAGLVPAVGLLDWRVQLLSVAIVGALSVYAIYSMPAFKSKLAELVGRL